MAQIEISSGGRWLLFLAGIAAVLTAAGRLVIQPLFAAWLFFTLKHEPEKVRGLICSVFEDDMAELTRSAREIRECQAEQGQQLARVEGYLTGRSE